MTEAEWMASTDPAAMLEAVRARASERKLRLFAIACGRRIWHRILAPRVRQAIEVAERFAEGRADPEEFQRSAATIRGGDHPAARGIMLSDPFLAAQRTAEWVRECCRRYAEWEGLRGGRADEARAQANLLRELFGNLDRPVSVDPSWQSWTGGTIPNLARSIHEERAFDRMPILADALEDAGCADAAFVSHLRGPGPHFRGCFVLDSLLRQN
jgi:hypothetical protein